MQPVTRKARGSSREAILAATQRLMVEEGYASVSTRRVAKEVGVAPALVHYHFPTTDDLLIALFRQLTARTREETIECLAGPEPLRALWKLSSHPASTAIINEFMALSNHRKIIRTEIAAYVCDMRAFYAEALMSDRPSRVASGDAPTISALGVTVLIAGMAPSLVMEAVLGVTMGHAEAASIIDGLIDAAQEGKIILS